MTTPTAKPSSAKAPTVKGSTPPAKSVGKPVAKLTARARTKGRGTVVRDVPRGTIVGSRLGFSVFKEVLHPPKLLDPSQLLNASDTDMISQIRQGMPSDIVDVFANYLDLPRASFLKAADLSLSTIERRLSTKAPLSPTESDRIYRIWKIIQRAFHVFESEESAKSWVARPNRALGGVTPLSLIDTEAGVDSVMDTLSRIEQGVVA